MSGGRSRELPAELARAKTRFGKWRRTRRAGARIPGELWSLATDLASTHGVNRTASVLRLDYYTLKKRVARADGPKRTPTAFVDVTPAAVAASGRSACVLELEGVDGTKMRVSLSGYSATDVMGVARGLWMGD